MFMHDNIFPVRSGVSLAHLAAEQETALRESIETHNESMLRDKFSKPDTGQPATVRSYLTVVVPEGTLQSIDASPEGKAILDAEISDVKGDVASDGSEFGFSGRIASLYGGVLAVVQGFHTGDVSGQPGTPNWEFDVALSFERPDQLSNITYLNFLQDLNPGHFSINPGHFSIVLSSIDWPGSLAPSPLFPLTQFNGDVIDVPVVKGVNFFTWVKPLGILQDTLTTILKADVEELSLSCGIGVNKEVTLRAAASGEATGADLASSLAAQVSGAAPAAFIAVKAYKFAGIQQVDVTRVVFVMKKKMGGNAPKSDYDVSLEADFTLDIHPGKKLPFQGEVELKQSGEKFDLEVSLKTKPHVPEWPWVDAFGVHGLTVGDAGLQLSLKDGVTSLGIRVNQLEIGSLSGGGAVRFTPGDASKTMFMFQLDKVSVHDVSQLFCYGLKVDIPADISNIAMEDVVVYVVPETTTIAGEKYEAGLKLAGKIDMLGWQGDIETVVEFSKVEGGKASFEAATGFKGYAYLEPIRLSASGEDFFSLTASGQSHKGFPAFPKPLLLTQAAKDRYQLEQEIRKSRGQSPLGNPPEWILPTGAKLAIEASLATTPGGEPSVFARVSMLGKIMNVVSADALGVVENSGYKVEIDDSVHAGSFGSITSGGSFGASG